MLRYGKAEFNPPALEGGTERGTASRVTDSRPTGPARVDRRTDTGGHT